MKLTRQIYLTGIALSISGSMHAQNLYWDTNGATPGAGNPADGDWDGATSNWTTDATGSSATSAYVTNSDVILSAGADAATANINVVGTQNLASLTFKNGDVTISGNNLDDDGDGRIEITVDSGASGTVNSTGSFSADFNIEGTFFANAITGGSLMSKTGAGTATFNRLDAILTVNQGTVIYTGAVSAKLKNTVINDTGSLQLTGNAFDGTKRSLTVNTGGQFSMAAGLSQTISLLSGGGSLTGGIGSALTVGGDNKNATFDGDIGGDLNIVSGGSGSFTLSSNSSMVFNIGNDGENNAILGDGVNDTATNLEGEFEFGLTGADLSDGNSWLIVDVDNLDETYEATFNIASFTESGGVWTYDVDNNLKFTESTGTLAYSIPEPGTYALLFGLSTLGLAYRRRTRA